MPMMREHFHWITGTVTNTPGTFAHTLGRKPWMVIPVCIGTAAGTVCFTYDFTNSTDKNVVLIGESATSRVFNAILIGYGPDAE